MYNYYPNYQRHDIIRVNGKGGAEAYQLMPNSSVLLLDETQPLVWLKTTDGAGYPTLTPYTITPYEPEKPVDVKSLEERLARVERLLDESDYSKHDEPKSKSAKKRDEHSA